MKTIKDAMPDLVEKKISVPAAEKELRIHRVKYDGYILAKIPIRYSHNGVMGKKLFFHDYLFTPDQWNKYQERAKHMRKNDGAVFE